MNLGFAARVAIVGVAYGVGAWLGVQYTATTSGIAVVWPPNAVLLAALLLSRPRSWPWYAAAALIAEIVAGGSAFPLWAALAFGFVNLFEATLAAVLLRWYSGARFRLDRLRDGLAYLLVAGGVASGLAAVAGAAVYATLGALEGGFLLQWRLWWFGDALGLLILGPAILTIASWWRGRRERVRTTPRPSARRVAEATAFAVATLAASALAFAPSVPGTATYWIEPLLLVPFGIVAAARYGVAGAAATVAGIAAVAVGLLTHGLHPVPGADPARAVPATQEILAVLAVVTVGLALVLDELKRQAGLLARKEKELRDQNALLERRVAERTEALERTARDLAGANARLARLATTDHLTELPNRRAFEEVGERERRRAIADGRSVSVLVFDLDRFKWVNDRHGHAVGDLVLRAVGEPVRSVLRPSDLFARTGGEEFSVLLVDSDVGQAKEVAERIRSALERMEVDAGGEAIRVTASFGVADVRGPDDRLAAVVERADAAMYRAKREGRNRVAT